MAISILIIEDEPATARNLSHILSEIDPGTHVLAIAGSVAEAVTYLQQHSDECDLIFSDIRLSDGLSFEVFEQVMIRIPVIFVTAYNDYALKAFKANGIDYILKPFDNTEIAVALDKFKLFGGGDLHTATDLSMLAGLLKSASRSYRQSFLIHYRDKLLPVAVARIAWFFTAHELVYLRTSDRQEYTVDFSMEQLQQELDPDLFFRANRQFIVSRESIKEVDFYFNGRLSLNLVPEPPERVLVSKARASEFKDWMAR